MNGFLHRLGARAMGRAGSVHSAARLPYAPPPTLAEAGETAVEPNPPVMNDPVPAATAQVGVSSASVGGTLPPLAPVRPAGSRHSGEGEPEDGASQSGWPPVRATASPSETLSAPEVSDVPNVAGAERNRPVPMAEEISAEAFREPLVRPGAADAGPAFPESVFTVLPPVAEPLLPPQLTAPAWSATERPADFSRRAASPGTPVEEITEVHVTIGRIEVTAVHEAPPPKRRPPAGAKPMTLEDYLAKRRGERR